VRLDRVVAKASFVVVAVGACGRPSAPPEAPIVVGPVRTVEAPRVASGDDRIAVARASRDPNPPGSTLHPEAVFVDPNPPDEWDQCAGFVNTSLDDVSSGFFDNCIGASRLRVRVFARDGELEEDVFVTDIAPEWSGHNYLGYGGTIVAHRFWGTLEGGASSLLFVGAGGKDACMKPVAPEGWTLGSGHGEKAIIAPGAKGYGEYRLSCGREDLPDRRIAIYR
jgi:hypothetical protein